MSKIIYLYGLRRSGIHAVSFAIKQKMHPAFLINNYPHRNFYVFSPLEDGTQKKDGIQATNDYLSTFNWDSNTIIALEDKEPNTTYTSLRSPHYKILLLRDHYNLFASRYKYYVLDRKMNGEHQFQVFKRLYLTYCHQFLEKNNDFLKVSYNRWISDPIYRTDLFKSLDIITDASVSQTVNIFGSSFQKFGEKIDCVELNERWKSINDDFFLKVIEDSELKDCTKAIFGL